MAGRVDGRSKDMWVVNLLLTAPGKCTLIRRQLEFARLIGSSFLLV